MAARSLEDAGLLGRQPDPGTEDAKGLSPLTLLLEPASWYTALETAMDDAHFGPPDGPSPVSPASRLVDRCRSLSS